MPSLLAEIHDVFLFLKCIAEVGLFTGLAVSSLIVFGYEIATIKRRTL